MACNSKENTLKHLRNIGIIDTQFRVSNIQEFERLNKVYQRAALSQYGLTLEAPFTLEKVSTKAITGHNTHRDNKIEYYRAVPNEQFFQSIDNYINAPSAPLMQDQLDYFDAPVGTHNDILSNTPITNDPAVEKTIEYKKNLVTRVYARLGEVSKAKTVYADDVVTLKELTKLEEALKERVDGDTTTGTLGLKDEIAILTTGSPISRLLYYFQRDFDRLKDLVESDNALDIKEARTIIHFHQRLGTFDKTLEHPLFDKDDLYDADNKINLSPTVYDGLVDLKNAADFYANKIAAKEEQLIVNTVNANKNIEKTFGAGVQFTHKELFHEENGLKDAAWVDMFLMDVTNGILSTNGIIPQVAMTELQHSFEDKLIYAKTVDARVDALQEAVEKDLRDLGYGFKFIGVKGVSYELFQAQDANGKKQDALIQRFTVDFANQDEKMRSNLEEMLDDARAELDPDIQKLKYRQAYAERDNWHRKHSIMLDVRKIPEVISDPENAMFSSFFNPADSAAYEAELRTLLGDFGYQEEVAKQQKLIKNYQTRLDVYTDSLLAGSPTGTLSPADQNRLEIWIKRNNPFIGIEAYETQQTILQGALKLDSYLNYNHYVPRRTKVNLRTQGKKVIIVDTTADTGYYDKNFEKIEAKPALKQFHNLVSEVQNRIYTELTPEDSKKLNAASLPAIARSIFEILFDPNTPFYQRISKAAREMWEGIFGVFGENVQSRFSYATRDPITGKPDYTVSSEFLQTNKLEIEKRAFVAEQELKQAFRLNPTKKFKPFTVLNVATNPAAIKILTRILGVKNDLASLQAALPAENLQQLEIQRVLKSIVSHQVVSEKSPDLPKILKMYTHLTMEYAARQEILPLMEVLKSHYEQIKAPETTNMGETSVDQKAGGRTTFEGLRTRAIRQNESWFQRAVLGDYSSKNEFGDTRVGRAVSIGIAGAKKILGKDVRVSITGRITRADEKELMNRIGEVRVELENILATSQDPKELADAQKALTKLNNIEDSTGKQFTFKAFMDAVFNLIRLKGLGWSVPSGVTNYMEGQIANMIIAARGDAFTSENIYRATNIMKDSFLKNMTRGKITTKEAKKSRTFMDRFNVLQDASNELQKASAKSAYSSFKNLSPYEITRRVEYLNQTPLMLSIMFDQKIQDINGNELNVFDATDPDGKLLDEFAIYTNGNRKSTRSQLIAQHGEIPSNWQAGENIKNWENADGDNYKAFKSHLIKTIVNTHGDYDTLRGNMASSTISGKAILMFKRWMARSVWQRFGILQPDVETGREKTEGWYRAHNSVTAAIHGGIIGFGGLGLLGAGPLGFAIGTTVGAVAGKLWGVKGEMHIAGQMAFLIKQLLMNYLRIPVNVLAGKAVISEGDYSKLRINSKHSELDERNMKALMIDLSLQLAWIALILMAKGLLWDDEDKKDDPQRRAHNILVNQFMKFSGQASMYSAHPMDFYKSTLGETALMRFLTDVQKLGTEAKDYIEGDDILGPGSPDAGKSALARQFKRTFLPTIFKQGIPPETLESDPYVLKGLGVSGFENQMRQQWEPSPFDSWFWSNNKVAKKRTSQIRAKYQRELMDQGMTEEKANTATKKKFRYKKKGESYEKLLKHYQKIEQKEEDNED